MADSTPRAARARAPVGLAGTLGVGVVTGVVVLPLRSGPASAYSTSVSQFVPTGDPQAGA